MKFLCVKLIIVVLLLTSCSGRTQDYNFEESFNAAVAGGFILPTGNIGAAASGETATVEARISDGGVQRTVSTVSAQFAHFKDLAFVHADRYLSGIYVERGRFVSAGDVLASTVFEPSDIQIAERRLRQQEFAHFEADTAEEHSLRRAEIDELRNNLSFACDSEWERYSLKLSHRELALEYFLHNSRRQRENLRRRLDELNRQLEPEQLIAPFCGIVTFVAQLAPGADFVPGQRIVSIADTNSLFFMATFTPGAGDPTENVLIRYGDVIPLRIPDIAEFYVRVASDAYAVGLRSGQVNHHLVPVNPDDLDALMYALEYDWLALERLAVIIYPTWNKFGEGIIMSTWNIQWDGYRPFVLVYENGSIGRRFVTLAPYLLPHRQVYIISGLEPGQRVVGE